MSSYDDIQNAKSALDQVEGAAISLQEYSDKVTKLAKRGKDLSEVQSVFNGVKVFGKLSTCFAMANIGLDLAMFAFGVDAPDPNEMILKAIDALDNKVTGMWSAMDVQFEKVHQHIDHNTAKEASREALIYFAGLQKKISLFREEPTPSLERDLLDERYDPADIESYFFTIYKNVTDSDKTFNPLHSAFEFSKGDAQKIVEVATPLMEFVVFAPMAYTFAAALRHKKDIDEPLSTPDDVDRLFQQPIEAISDECQKWISACKDDAQLKVSIEKTLDDYFTVGLKNGRDGYFRYYPAAQELCAKLQKKWYWLDWLVIIGEGDFGEASGYKMVKKSEKPITKKRENATVMVTWTPSNLPSTYRRGSSPLFSYKVYADHNFTAHWSNPERVYFWTFMGHEPAHVYDDVRRSLKLPAGHIIKYSDHFLASY